MLSKEQALEIKQMEKEGLDVVVVSSNGTLDYSTRKLEDYNSYCDQCKSFRLVDDPDPYDWFRDENKKAICLEVNGIIEGSLETPSEWTKIKRPLYCPKLNRTLTDIEQKEASKMLEFARKRMENN